MPRCAEITVSFTETRQFRRLVLFLHDVENVARIDADEELQRMVDECREDLAAGREEPRWLSD